MEKNFLNVFVMCASVWGLVSSPILIRPFSCYTGPYIYFKRTAETCATMMGYNILCAEGIKARHRSTLSMYAYKIWILDGAAPAIWECGEVLFKFSTDFTPLREIVNCNVVAYLRLMIRCNQDAEPIHGKPQWSWTIWSWSWRLTSGPEVDSTSTPLIDCFLCFYGHDGVLAQNHHRIARSAPWG